jgi:hypothetical protein
MNKTKPTKVSVASYLAACKDPAIRADAKKLAAIFADVTKAKATMWGSMIGYGTYHYVYDSGREGDWFVTGFAMRAKELTIYGMSAPEMKPLIDTVGPHKLSGSCLHIKGLTGINIPVLKKLITMRVKEIKKEYGAVMK